MEALAPAVRSVALLDLDEGEDQKDRDEEEDADPVYGQEEDDYEDDGGAEDEQGENRGPVQDFDDDDYEGSDEEVVEGDRGPEPRSSLPQHEEVEQEEEDEIIELRHDSPVEAGLSPDASFQYPDDEVDSPQPLTDDTCKFADN